MKVVIKPGEAVSVELEGTDGTFTVDFDTKGDGTLLVKADLPDTHDRVGVIYEERFSQEYLDREMTKRGIKRAGEE